MQGLRRFCRRRRDRRGEGSRYAESIEALNNRPLLAMLAKNDKWQDSKKRAKYPAILQPKLDGNRSLSRNKDGAALLTSGEGGTNSQHLVDIPLSRACSLFACLNSFIIMTDMPTAPARTLIDVEQVGMLLLSHLRCRFQVPQLLMGRFLARKEEFATPFAVRSAVAPQRPPLRQKLYVPFSHPGMHFIADAAPRDLQRSPENRLRSCDRSRQHGLKERIKAPSV
jgi:hypothetical protein